jgi:hypothetical protein
MTSAHLASVEALVEFRARLAVFGDEAKDALGSIDMVLQRAVDWLDDQKKYWEKQIHLRHDAVFVAKQNLKRREMMKTVGGRKPDCSEEQKALALAEHRLAEAEQKLANCRAWSQRLPREIDDYRGPGRQLQNILEGDLPRRLANLEARLQALAAYLTPQPTANLDQPRGDAEASALANSLDSPADLADPAGQSVSLASEPTAPSSDLS